MTFGLARWICLAWLCLISFSAHAVQPMISAGGFHTVAVHTDGTLRAWGSDRGGQLGAGRTAYSNVPARVSGMPPLKSGPDSAAAGEQDVLAIAADGTLWAWGYNQSGQLGDGTTSDRTTPVRVVGISSVNAVAASRDHSLAVTADGAVWSWGSNLSGQLGTGTTLNRAVPVPVPGLAGFTAVAAGQQHSVALRSDGSVWAWGDNSRGQLGDGTTTRRLSPVQVTGIAAVTRIAAGPFYTLALKGDGTVWAWGDNGAGQLGDGTTVNRTTPVNVPGMIASGIAAGYGVSMAVKSDGTVWWWGQTAGGAVPTLNPGFAGNVIVDVKLGDFLVVARRNDGTVFTAGSSVSGQLGRPSPEPPPAPVPGLGAITTIVAGGDFVLAVGQDGSLYAWGNNSNGQLGIPQILTQAIPMVVAGLSGVSQVSAGNGGDSHTVAVRSDGTVWAWGSNGYGELGFRGSLSSQPLLVSGISNVVQVAAGAGHTVALKNDGTVWAWGSNSDGQLGDGSSGPSPIGTPDGPRQVPGLASVVKIAAGLLHTLAVRGDGSVWAWGNNTFGQLGVASTASCTFAFSAPQPCVTSPVQIPGISGVADIAGGGGHTLARLSDGTVWAWGDNSAGQLGDGTATTRSAPAPVASVSSVLQVAAGGNFCTPGCGNGHSLVLKSDGTVWAWGSNDRGQLGDGTTTIVRRAPVPVAGLNGVVAISAGMQHSAAIRSDGTVWSWGRNSDGQLGDGTYSARAVTVLVSNDTADGALDLIPKVANNIPADKIPPFFLSTIKTGDLTATNLSVNVKGGTARGTLASDGHFAATYNVYVAAYVPALQASTPWWQLDSNRSWGVLSSPMAEYLRGAALESQTTTVRAEILQNVDLSQLIGSVVYVGYGTDTDEMLRAGRYRDIYTVPSQ
jgi:alpha-tubulin suppressor-like RCC1 family protein